MEEQMNYDQMWQEEKPFADRLAVWIKARLNPTRVVDLGCGPGMHVYALQENQVNAVGYDTDIRVDNKPFLHRASMFDVTDPADLVLCFEVAEHLPYEQSDLVVDSMIRNMERRGILIWTAAIPGQGGVGHINCQYKPFWLQKFADRGLVRMSDLELEMLTYVQQGYHMGWFVQNAMVFIKL
jgi:SAM-dependent methyltransferase